MVCCAQTSLYQGRSSFSISAFSNSYTHRDFTLSKSWHKTTVENSLDAAIRHRFKNTAPVMFLPFGAPLPQQKKSLARGADKGLVVCVLDTVFLFKSINTAAGIHEFLFACKERMAVGANLNAQILFNGTRFERIAASTCYGRYVVFWLNLLFHVFHLFLP